MVKAQAGGDAGGAARPGGGAGGARGGRVEGSAGGPRRPEHHLTPDEVDAWLAGSPVTGITFHRTTPEAAEGITEHGVDIERSRVGAYGLGFYTATQPVGVGATLELAVKLRNPLVGPEAEVADFLDGVVLRRFPRSSGIGRVEAAGIREELLAMGYDGLIVGDAGGDGIDYVIALDGETVKVVVRP